jgi:hypothetical protein
VHIKSKLCGTYGIWSKECNFFKALPPDSDTVRRNLECDSPEQVLYRKIETLNRQLIEARAALANKETETDRRHTEAEVTIREVPRRARWWEKLFFWIGVAATAAGTLWTVYNLKK